MINTKEIIFIINILTLTSVSIWILTTNVAKEENQSIKIDYSTVIGIDLGTTYSCVGVVRKGKIEIIPNEFGRNITPSYVAFTDYGEILIGDEAKNYLTTDPTNTVYDSKRLIGNLFNSSTLQNDMKYWPFKIINKDNKPFIQIRNKHFHKDFSPVEISALILKKMKEIAEEYLNEKITYAVITVSAYFNDAQRQATMDAASIAGLTVLRLLNEPVAASLAYGLDKKQADKKDDNGRNILVYDLGGGTFDASILNINEGVFEVISTKGDTHLGGQDFDNQIIEYLINQYEMKNGIQIGNNTKLIQKLRREVEKAKRILSTKSSTTIDIESFFDDKPFQIDLSRRQFERINKDLFERTLMHIENVIKDAGLNNSKIDEVVLIGGSTLIPNIQKIISEFFNNKKLYTEINPHEAVAHGAAIQASIMSGSNNYPNNPVLVDTNPMNLGIEIKDGNMSELISRNNPKPFKRSQLFTTTEDYQKSVLIQIYEGDYPKAKQNNLLGVFELKDISLEPKGQPLIEVTFEIDANGILIVTAQDIYNMTNKNKIEINNTLSRISELDIKKMTDEHEHLMQRNKRIQRKLNAKNQLEAYAFKMKHKNNYNERSLRKIEETITWLELNGINADTNEYSLRLNELKQLEKDEF